MLLQTIQVSPQPMDVCRRSLSAVLMVLTQRLRLLLQTCELHLGRAASGLCGLQLSGLLPAAGLQRVMLLCEDFQLLLQGICLLLQLTGTRSGVCCLCQRRLQSCRAACFSFCGVAIPCRLALSQFCPEFNALLTKLLRDTKVEGRL